MKGKKILVATDLSENSEPAAKAAVELARTLRKDLEVLHVLDLTSRKSTEKMEIFHDLKLRQKAEARLEKWFDQVSGTEPDAVYLRIGDPAEVIREEAAAEDVALLVIAMSGRGAWNRLIFGSTVMKVASRPTKDTAVIHPDVYRFANGMTIGVGVDFSPASDQAVQAAAELARQTGSALRIVHVNALPVTTVIHEGDLPPGSTTTEMVNWAEESMEDLRQKHSDSLADLDVEYKVVADHPVAGLRSFVEEQGIDWLVLGDRMPEQRKGASTVKGKWVQRATCSTLIVPKK